VVEKFLLEQKPGSIGLDIGCGNGKYMSVNKDVYIVGSDHSSQLTQIAFNNHAQNPETHANNKHADAMVADGLNLPFMPNYFDFAISIAVIHHFSTPERRIESVRHILNTIRPGGRALIYVWALEQENSRRGYHEGMDQDVLVPWVLQNKQKKKKKQPPVRRKKNVPEGENQEPLPEASQEPENEKEQEEEKKEEVVKQRYYHLYKKGELEADVEVAGGRVVESGYSRDNWYSIITK
jgi:tRNA (uracil-5-)-methyltransferase TRM9